MTGPKRIQLSRRKGYRKPEGAVVVSRGTSWGNPFAVGAGVVEIEGSPMPTLFQQDAPRVIDRAHAVKLYRRWLDVRPEKTTAAIRVLRGYDLACWCPLDDQPCHADVLLDIANGGAA